MGIATIENGATPGDVPMAKSLEATLDETRTNVLQHMIGRATLLENGFKPPENSYEASKVDYARALSDVGMIATVKEMSARDGEPASLLTAMARRAALSVSGVETQNRWEQLNSTLVSAGYEPIDYQRELRRSAKTRLQQRIPLFSPPKPQPQPWEQIIFAFGKPVPKEDLPNFTRKALQYYTGQQLIFEEGLFSGRFGSS